MEIDETDRKILRRLQADARTPISEIAREIDMSSAAVHDRVSKLEDEGIIDGYHAKVDPSAAGYGISAFVGIRVEQGGEWDTLERLRDIDGVQEVHLVTGEWDVLMRVFAEDADELRELMFSTVPETDGFNRSQTMVILGTDYEDDVLPL
jgi:Lrp/AsnC family transcriptional regulator for asnA, asnC and gidA